MASGNESSDDGQGEVPAKIVSKEDAIKQRRTTMRRLTTSLMNKIQENLGESQLDQSKLEDNLSELKSKEDKLEKIDNDFESEVSDSTVLDAWIINSDNYANKVRKVKDNLAKALNAIQSQQTGVKGAMSQYGGILIQPVNPRSSAYLTTTASSAVSTTSTVTITASSAAATSAIFTTSTSIATTSATPSFLPISSGAGVPGIPQTSVANPALLQQLQGFFAQRPQFLPPTTSVSGGGGGGGPTMVSTGSVSSHQAMGQIPFPPPTFSAFSGPPTSGGQLPGATGFGPSFPPPNPSSANIGWGPTAGNLNQQFPMVTGMKLPEYKIKKFSGDNTQWTDFWAIFEITVDKQPMENKLKLLYLRSYLEGPPANAIASLELTNTNYDIAVKILKNRYGRNDDVIRLHVINLKKLQPVTDVSNVTALRKLYDHCEVEIAALEAVKSNFKEFGPVLCPLIVELLPVEITLEYSRRRDVDQDWDVKELLLVFRREVETRERASLYMSNNRGANANWSSGKTEQRSTYGVYGKGNFKGKGGSQSSAGSFNVGAGQYNPAVRCIFCRRTNHKRWAVSIAKKKAIIRSQGRCFICAKADHIARECTGRIECKNCGKRHITALCEARKRDDEEGAKEKSEDKNDKQEKPKESEDTSPKTINAGQHLATNGSAPGAILLQTARLQIVGKERTMTLRCLFDGGSQRSFIRRDISQQLGLEEDGQENLLVHAFAQKEPRIVTCKRVKVKLRSLHDKQYLIVTALEIPEISGAKIETPCEEIREKITKLGLTLGDQDIYQNSTDQDIGFLLGADYYWSAVSVDEIIRLKGALVVQKSKFGWLLQGPSDQPMTSIAAHYTAISVNHASVRQIEEIGGALRKFWELESLGIKENEPQERETEAAQKRFESQIKMENGRYEVSLPWKEIREELPDNFNVAVKRLFGLLRKLEANKPLLKIIDDIFKEYAKEGIIELAKESRKTVKSFFLPHHPVVREDRTTTKVREVFDASAHDRNQLSLNDCLEAGPNINPDLYDVLINFRKHRVAVTADIQQAFLQISINPEDRDYLRFLWIKNPFTDDPPEIEEWRFTRVVFGVNSSPYILAGTIRHHTKKFEDIYPETCARINNDTYVDDFTSGARDDDAALKLIAESREVMAKANMTLRKFQTNSPTVREVLKETYGEAVQEAVFQFSDINKVLGLAWNPVTDTFSFKVDELVKVLESLPLTKRSVLKISARIFDPTGFLTPYTIIVKILLQRLWLKGIDWDQALPEELAIPWEDWSAQLKEIPEIRIDRYYFRSTVGSEPVKPELYIFCDSSEAAYGAVAYFRYSNDKGDIDTAFVTSRARVAPVKKQTIPRLELLACLIGARLGKRLASIFEMSLADVSFWTDSSIAYYWIKGGSRDKKQFVANRISEIQQISDPQMWHHCRGVNNPADHASRGLSADKLRKNEIWWKGPPWLRLSEDLWPRSNFEEVAANIVADDVPEIPKKENPKNSILMEKKPVAILDLEKFSCVKKVIRITAWVRRFITAWRRRFYPKSNNNRPELEIGPLTTEELEKAELDWDRCVQWECFKTEITDLARTGRTKNSAIAELNPIIDENGVMRLGGRLQNSEFSYATKHPIILPYKHRYSDLRMKESHERVHHSGAPETLIQIRAKYWIIKGRQLSKNCVARCYFCRKWNAKRSLPKTAPLPSDRITVSRPYEVVGIDFAGPLFMKDGNKTKKCYVALITCATTRAVHLELVTNLSTRNFIMAFKNFISRRGIPRKIYSDNARTFKRAEREFNALFRCMRSDEAKDYFADLRIEWRYIVELGPWWGGFWERLVRSVKTSMRKVIGQAFLSYEELYSVIVQVEAIINSRPLTYSYSAPNDPSPLTPAHFLIGDRLTALPTRTKEGTLPESNRANLEQRLTYQRDVLTSFWNRWKREYLLELQSAHKLKNSETVNPFAKGDVVLLNDHDTPRHKWTLGLVQEIYVGRDGHVRSCDLKIPNGKTVKRPVNLVYPLELKNNSKN